ncbi:hypothetical protein ACDX78_12440 [Virgibacillus oceani]
MTIITRKDNIVEDYHGVKVADPYRCLEDANSTEVKIWTDEQNKQTQQHLIDFPQSETIKENITNLMSYTKYSLPKKKGWILLFS